MNIFKTFSNFAKEEKLLRLFQNINVQIFRSIGEEVGFQNSSYPKLTNIMNHPVLYKPDRVFFLALCVFNLIILL
jgi:hypothetical protein